MSSPTVSSTAWAGHLTELIQEGRNDRQTDRQTYGKTGLRGIVLTMMEGSTFYPKNPEPQ